MIYTLNILTLPVAPLWCDLGFVPYSRGNKAAANLRPIYIYMHIYIKVSYITGYMAATLWLQRYIIHTVK